MFGRGKCAVLTIFTMIGFDAAQAADQLARVTMGDEYAPYVTSLMPNGGYDTQLVREIFTEQGYKIEFDILPWTRGYAETATGAYIGTFPYVKTVEREKEFLYSTPIHINRVTAFRRKGETLSGHPFQGSVCVPLGYARAVLDIGKVEFNSELSPSAPDLATCFRMLINYRVDVVPIDFYVGHNAIRGLRPEEQSQVDLESKVIGEVPEHFIVSKIHPDAQKWIDMFNRALEKKRESGRYDEIYQIKRQTSPRALRE